MVHNENKENTLFINLRYNAACIRLYFIKFKITEKPNYDTRFSHMGDVTSRSKSEQHSPAGRQTVRARGTGEGNNLSLTCVVAGATEYISNHRN